MALLLALLLAAVSVPADLEEAIRRVAEAYAAVEREAAEAPAPEKVFYEGVIPGMLRPLDPHSVFFSPEQFEQLKQLQESRTKGFGSVVSVLPGRVIVLQALPGTPSAKGGLEPGDEILAINGIRLDRLDMEQLVALLSRSRQHEVKLDVRKPGNARILQLVLTPEEMDAPSVERAFFLKPGVGYLRVSSFDAETGKQIREAIEKLGGDSLTGLVLDLRNNPGGLLPAALETASLFLQPGQTILTVRGRAVEPREEKVPAGARSYRFPVAVIINERTASAAEIVAGSLQDHKRAVIVGEPSFGKGLVESVYPLSEGTGVALTTAYYYTPSGRSIQRPLPGHRLAEGRSGARGGIQPDVVAYPESLTRLQIVLDATGSFTAFATDYVRTHPGVTEQFEVSPDLLDDFRVFLAQRKIQPSIGEWSAARPWIENRLKTEIFNLALGVAKGDEVEAQRDPQIQAALRALAASAGGR
ncbi:MAG: S41 family peptidase [Bryobacterales bacterium]|nr:S41 family peptidase [Bryobacteraceae bacterium]MDW8356126.1 S41 family peptidase [Bryobacterales bacterium]